MPRLKNGGPALKDYRNPNPHEGYGSSVSFFDLCSDCYHELNGKTCAEAGLFPFLENEPEGILVPGSGCEDCTCAKCNLPVDE